MAIDKTIGTQVDFYNDIRFVGPVTAYVSQLCESFEIDSGDKNKILLSLEEALVYAIENFYDEEHSPIELKVLIEPTQMKLVIKDKGLPMDPASLPEYSAEIGDIDSGNQLSGIGIFIIKNMMDGMEFKNLGKDGKEWHMTKKFTGKRIDFLVGPEMYKSPQDELKQDVQSVEYTIRDFIPEDSVKISKLAYNTYGYSYADYIYYPEKITDMVGKRELISQVAVTPSGEIIGHMALEFSDDSDTVAELGVAFTNPKYRGLKVFHKLNLSLIEKAEEVGLKGFFVNAVTGHIASQKGSARYGLKPVGIILGAYPCKTYFKGLTDVIEEKLNALLMFSPLNAKEEKKLYVPVKYANTIERTYAALSIKRKYTVGEIRKNISPEKGIVNSSSNSVLNTASIKVLKCGKDTVEEIVSKWKYHKLDRVDTVYLYLNLEDESTPAVVEEANGIGFIYAGMLPDYLNGKDTLILQYPNNLKIKFDDIELFHEESKEILAQIRSEYERNIL